MYSKLIATNIQCHGDDTKSAGHDKIQSKLFQYGTLHSGNCTLPTYKLSGRPYTEIKDL